VDSNHGHLLPHIHVGSHQTCLAYFVWYISVVGVVVRHCVRFGKIKKRESYKEPMEAFLESKYQEQLHKFSPAYAQSSQWYVGPRLMPYLYNYLHLPTLFFSDNLIDYFIDQWLHEYYQQKKYFLNRKEKQ
tara:strand:+ start:390 stop:782 length:393 start_codon:yes stop_codon:yes gene_type:complete